MRTTGRLMRPREAAPPHISHCARPRCATPGAINSEHPEKTDGTLRND